MSGNLVGPLRPSLIPDQGETTEWKMIGDIQLVLAAHPAPSVSIALSDYMVKAAVVVTLSFSTEPFGFTLDDIAAPNGSLSLLAPTADPLIYTAWFTPNAGTLDTLNLMTVGMSWTDSWGFHPLQNAVSANYVVATLQPSVVITCLQESPSAVTPLTFVYSWSENVMGFDVDKAGISGGTKLTFVAISDSVYTLDVKPDALSTVTATVAAGACQNEIGNSNLEATPLSIVSTISLLDQFSDADGVRLSVHIPDIKTNGWVEISGTWDIKTNKAEQVVSGGTTLCLLNANRSDVTILANVTLGNAGGEYVTIVFRRNGADYWTFQLSPDRGGSADWFLSKVGSGAGLVGSGQLNFLPLTDHSIRVDLDGANIEVFVDGLSVKAATDAYCQAATFYGLGIINSVGADKGQRIDSIKIANFSADDDVVTSLDYHSSPTTIYIQP